MKKHLTLFSKLFTALILLAGINAQAQTITTNPDSVCVNSVEAYRVDSVNGSTYAWQVMEGTGAILGGQTTAHISIQWDGTAGIDSVEVIETNEHGCDGDPNYLKVIKIAEPTISLNFSDSTVCRGSEITFVSNYTGITPFVFEWFKDDVLIPGQTGDTLTIATADELVDIGDYKVVISTPCSNDTSDVASLFVTTPPEIYQQPDSLSACLGDSVALEVLATGTRPFIYQWQRNGVDVVNGGGISGATDSLLILNPITYADTGLYRCYMINSCDSVMSEVAYVHINVAPDFAVQTDSVSTCLGSTDSIWFSPIGDSLTFQWYKNDVAIAGATDTILRFDPVAYADTANYYCVSTNVCGLDTSDHAYLNINIVPVITNQPDSLSICMGNDAQFVVEATGDSLNYQWYKDGNPLPGETNDTLNFSNIDLTYEGNYTVVITNTCASIESDTAQLNINIAPEITANATGVSLCPGSDYEFFVLTTGDSLNYQWKKNGVDIPGETNDTIFFTNLQYTDTANYTCYVWNNCGDTLSGGMYMYLYADPVIVNQPADISACEGTNITINFETSGDITSYELYRNGGLFTTTTNTSVSFAVSAIDEGEWYYKAISPCTFIESDSLHINVNSAPVITAQSDSISTCIGESEYFWVEATGDTLTYQWYKNAVAITGETNDTLYFNNIVSTDEADYHCIVTNMCNTATTFNMYLNLNIVPVITDQPDSVSSCVGQNVAFNVVATGDSLNYTWYKNGVEIVGETTASLALNNIDLVDEGNYTVRVYNTCGFENSANAHLNINRVPVILAQSDSVSTCLGANHYFWLVADGDSLNYQWRKNGVDMPGENNDTLFFTNIAVADEANYTCYISNTCSNATTQNMHLNINVVPQITNQPDSISSCVGQNVAFTVVATGDSLNYTWYKNGVEIAGETTATLALNSIDLPDEANYTVKVYNTCGFENSANANLNINRVPVFLAQSDSVSTCLGANHYFFVVMDGDSLNYQWRKDGIDIPGETNDTLFFNNIQLADEANYQCIITNTCGTELSQNMHLNYNIAPVITDQPDSISSCVGANEAFTVVVSGDSLNYQWYKNSVAITGETAATLSLNNIDLTDEGDYEVVVTNTCGTETSVNANLNINRVPIIMFQSDSVSTCLGANHYFYVVVDGDSLNYQWRKNGIDMPGENNDTLFFNNIQLADEANYQCIITNTCGSALSQNMHLNYNIAPVITDQPDSISTCVGVNVALTVIATGDSLNYQWYKNGAVISGETTPILSLNTIDLTDEGDYEVVVSNTCGTETSVNANLNINRVPVIMFQSDSISTCLGEDEFFFVVVDGDSLNYQWRKNSVDIPGATNDTLYFTNIQLTDEANYECVITNTCGNATSQNMHLNYNIAPQIIDQPDSTSTCAGLNHQFNIIATGDSLNYQWYKNGVAMAGETSPSLSFVNISIADEANYTVEVFNTCGTLTSNNAHLNINRIPVIIEQSDSISSCLGEDEFFYVVMDGDSLNYQWRKNGVPMAGKNNDTLYFNNITLTDEANYECRISNTCGNVTTLNMHLNYNLVPHITSQPVEVSSCIGNATNFAVTATGDSLNYQWYLKGNPIAGATLHNLVINPITYSDTGHYQCRVYNTCGEEYSNSVLLNVNIVPQITDQPDSVSTCLGQTVQFEVAASGDSLNYQWYFKGLPIAGAQNPTHIINSVIYSDTGSYTVRVFNTCGEVWSQNANLNVNIVPTITDQPLSLLTCIGDFTSFNVTAAGDSLFYQWQKDGVDIPGAIASTLPIGPIGDPDIGIYRVLITNTCGMILSDTAHLYANLSPDVIDHPDPVSSCLGQNISFVTGITAGGSALPNFQWQFNGVDIPGETSNILNINNIQYADTGAYRCYLWNNCDAIYTNEATLNINIAPQILAQPQPVSACIGDEVNIWVEMYGDSLNYQWYRNGIPIPSETDSIIHYASVNTSDTATYYCEIWNTCGSVTTNPALLNINMPPVIHVQPINQDACEGETKLLSVTATGDSLNYQWVLNGVDVPGATNPTYLMDPIQFSDAGDYYCRIWNNCGMQVTNTVYVYVNIVPDITLQPADLSTCDGDAVTLYCQADGDFLTYQWKREGIDIPGANGTSFTIDPITPATTGNYTCEVSNYCGFDVSDQAKITINAIPVITDQPDSLELCEGYDAQLTVVSDGDSLFYQWRKEGVDIPGANSATLHFTPATLADKANYECYVFNTCGDEFSQNAYLNVNEAPQIATQPLDETLCENDSVSMWISVTGDNISYQWMRNGVSVEGETDSIITFNPASLGDTGYYHCEISSAYCGILLSDSARLEVIPTLIITAETSNISCFGEGNGAIDISVTNGDEPYEFLWSNGATSEDISNLDPGTYSVYIADANICSISKEFEIGQPDSLRFGLDTAFWSMAHGFGGGETDILRDMVTDKNGYIYVTGSFRSDVDFGGATLTSFGNNDVFVAKYDSLGQLMWADHAGGTLDDESRGIGVDTLGNVYVTGYVKELAFFGGNEDDTVWTAGAYDAFIASWAADGTYRWVNSAGGFFNDYSNAIHTDKLGNSYITGSFQGRADFNHLTFVSAGGDDIFTAKYNESGDLQWVKTAGGSSQDFGEGISVDISENTIVTGRFQGTAHFDGKTLSSAGSNDIFLLKYNNLGQQQWVQRSGGSQDDRGEALAVDYSGNIYQAGSFGGSATFNARTINSRGGTDMFTARYDRGGNLRWIRTAGGTQNDYGHAIDVDVLNNVYTAGTYRGTAFFPADTLESVGSSDVYVTKFNSSGLNVWTHSGGSPLADSSCAIAITPEEEVLTGGSFRSTADFGAHQLVSNGDQDIFFAKIKDTTYQRQPIIQFVDCFGGDEGFIDISMAGGTLPYEYYWSTGDTVPDLWNIEEGTYWLFVDDANGCSFDTAMIIEYQYPLPEPPLVAYSDRDYFCSTDPGDITLTAEGGSGDVMRWLEGSCDGIELGTGASITLPSPEVTTTYYVRWENGCDTSECISVTVNVFETSAPPEDIIVDVNNYCTGTVDYINLEAVGGYGEILKWYIDGCGTTEIGTGTPFAYPAPLDTTVLYARWESSCGNSVCDSISIIVNPSAQPVDTAYVDTTGFCYDYTGTITLTSVGGSGNDIYWREGSPNGTIVGITPVITIDAPDAPTTYYVYWENNCGNSALDSVSVDVDPMPVVMDEVHVDTNYYCIGSVDSITLTAIGGIGDEVVWSVGYCGSPTTAGIGNPLTIAAPTSQTTYQAYWQNDCGQSICKGITVYPQALPTVSFSGLAANYCIDGLPVTLTGNHAPEGTFSGTGITDNGNGTATFDPQLAGLGGPYEITYTYTNTNGCSASDIQITSVTELPFVDFTGLGDEYCIYETPVTLTGNFAPTGTFTGAGITDNGNGTATFDPALAGAGGPYDITYTYADPASGCAGSKTKTTVVHGTTQVWFTLTEPAYCVDGAPIPLTGNMAPEGYFEGPGIINTGLGQAQFVPALAGVGGPHEITYIYNDPVTGCQSDSSRFVTVNDLPAVSFTGLEPQYCLNTLPSLLTGNHLGYGSFSGAGISDYGNGSALFDPAVAGVGTHDITYTYTDPNGCTNDSTLSTTVYAIPELSVSGLDTAYCVEAAWDTIYGNMAPQGSFSGPGITDLADGRAIFKPAEAGIGGPYVINYTFSDGNGCENTATYLTKVVAMPVVAFLGLEAEYCVNEMPDTLTGNYEPAGTFSGPGITNLGNGKALFDPALAGVGGPYDIVYSYESEYGCVSDTTIQTTVNPIPSVNFTGLEDYYCLNGGQDTLTGNHAPEGTFSGPGITDNGDGTAYFDPAIAGVGGPFTIVYTYSDANGCTNDTLMSTLVLDPPAVSFTGLPEIICVNADSILLTGSQFPFGIFSGDGINDMGNGTAWFNPAAAGTGFHDVTYSYQDIFGCSNDTTESINVWPTPEAPTDMFVDTTDFCAGTIAEVTLTIDGGYGDEIAWFYGACGDSLLGITTDTLLNIVPPSDTAWFFARWQNDCGASACDSVQIIVTPQPVAPIAATVDTSFFCGGTIDSIQLTAIGGSGVNLTWYSESCGGTLLGNGTSIKIEAPDVSTEYFARWANSCDTTECASVEVIVFPEAIVPDSLESSDNGFCAGSIDEITLTAYGGVGDQLSWTEGSCNGSPIGFGTALTIVAPTEPTWYFAHYSNTCNISPCDSIFVDVAPIPVVPDTVYSDHMVYCDGTVDSIQLIAEGGFGDYVLWFENSCGGPVMGMGNPLKIEAPTVTTRYFGRYENDCGESSCISLTVHVDQQPQAPELVTVDTSNYCPGYPYALKLEAFGGYGDQLNWYKDSCTGEYLGSYNPIYVESPDTSTVYLAAWENVCGQTECVPVEVIVNTPIVPDSIIADTNMFCISDTEPIRLEAIGGFGDSLRWTVGNPDNEIIGTGNPFFAPVPDTSTYFYAYYETECGISSSDSIFITVVQMPLVPDSLVTDTNHFCPAAIDSLMLAAIGGYGDTISGQEATVRWFEGSCNGEEVGTGDTLWLQDVPVETTWFFARWENVCGVSDCDSIEIVVNNTIPVDSLALDTNNICPGIPQEITLMAFGGYGDTLKWYKDSITGPFVGNGTELTILNPDTTTTYFAQWQNPCNASDYDSIKLIVNIPTLPDELILSMNNYCSDTEDSITLNYTGGNGDTLRWYMRNSVGGLSKIGDGQNVKIDAPAESKWLYARFDNVCGMSAYDSIFINVIPAATVYAGISDSICEGSYYDLVDAMAEHYDSVRWTAGSGSFVSGNTVNTRWLPAPDDITEADTVWIKLTAYGASPCGAYSDSLSIIVNPLPELFYTPEDLNVCQQHPIALEAFGAQDYLWSPAEGLDTTAGSRVVARLDESITYQIKGTTAKGCADSINVSIPVHPIPYVNLGPDITKFGCDPIELDAGYSAGNYYYQWNNGDPRRYIEVESSGTYSVRAWNEGCSTADTIKVTLCQGNVEIPNAFSPNNDGLNDRFRIKVSDPDAVFSIYIYNRAGALVYKSDDAQEGWDGRNLDGKECPFGNYVYILSLQGDGEVSGIQQQYNGVVTLIR